MLYRTPFAQSKCINIGQNKVYQKHRIDEEVWKMQILGSTCVFQAPAQSAAALTPPTDEHLCVRYSDYSVVNLFAGFWAACAGCCCAETPSSSG